jgi:carbamoyltransferase
MSIAGKTRKNVDVAGFSRTEFPTIFYKNIRACYIEKRTRRYMPREFLRYNTTCIDDIFKVDKFRQVSGFRDDTKVFFYNHHEAHALAPLFYSDWNDALLVTADAGGDTVNYSYRHFANGALKTIYGS